jgi:ribonuclease BN (tRNA processing enzyme)
MGQLLKLGVHINDIDMILLSHFHLDHCAEIAPFLFATKYPEFKRKKKLVLVGGTGIKALFEKLNSVYDNILEIPEDYFHIIELGEKGSLNLNLEGIQLDYNSVSHRPESRAYRLTNETGFSMVYSGDTDYSDHLIDLSRESDILICESALPDEQKVPGHLTPSLAGEIAAKANVKKLVLTHFYPECDTVDIKAQCQKTFTGPVILAEDLLNL